MEEAALSLADLCVRLSAEVASFNRTHQEIERNTKSLRRQMRRLGKMLNWAKAVQEAMAQSIRRAG